MRHAPWRNEPTELSTGIVDNENVKIDSAWVSKYRGGVTSGGPCGHRYPVLSHYSTVTLLARLRGWSTSVPFTTAT